MHVLCLVGFLFASAGFTQFFGGGSVRLSGVHAAVFGFFVRLSGVHAAVFGFVVRLSEVHAFFGGSGSPHWAQASPSRSLRCRSHDTHARTMLMNVAQGVSELDEFLYNAESGW